MEKWKYQWSYEKQQWAVTQWHNFVPGCPWVPVAQSEVDAPGGVILGTTQLT